MGNFLRFEWRDPIAGIGWQRLCVPECPCCRNVRTGVSYSAGTRTGTLTLPAVSNVRSGVSFGSGGTEFTGTVTLPATSNVRSTVQYGAAGTEFTGTVTLPSQNDVRWNTNYGAGGSEFTGNLLLPTVGNVRLATGYGSSGAELVGTFVVPAVGNVRSATQYGAAGTEYTGTFVVPAVGTVVLGTQYGAGGTEYTGTFSIYAGATQALTISYNEVRRQIGRLLGYSRVPSDWSETEALDVADIIKSGERSFYFPTIEGETHSWSFLSPVNSLSLVNGTRNYALPADFIRVVGEFTFNDADGFGALKLLDESQIRTMYSRNDASGTPRYVSIRATQTGYEAIFYPKPDNSYTVKYRYERAPNNLGEINSYPLGGPLHSETFLEACLAAAEKTMNPETLEQGGGYHAQRFVQLLAASVRADLQVTGSLVPETPEPA